MDKKILVSKVSEASIGSSSNFLSFDLSVYGANQFTLSAKTKSNNHFFFSPSTFDGLFYPSSHRIDINDSNVYEAIQFIGFISNTYKYPVKPVRINEGDICEESGWCHPLYSNKHWEDKGIEEFAEFYNLNIQTQIVDKVSDVGVTLWGGFFLIGVFPSEDAEQYHICYASIKEE